MNDFTTVIPTLLLDRAFTFKTERAWSRADALQVIAIIKQAGFTILGVDIWIPSAKGEGPVIPTPFVYDWSSDDWKTHPFIPESAAAFVETFTWDPTDTNFLRREPYFNLTVSD